MEISRFVLDSHVWVSFFYRGRFEKILQQVILHEVTLYTCREQLSEFADIHSKHPRIAEMLPLKTRVYTDAIRNSCILHESQKRYALLPDYKDNYLVDIAHQTKSALVTNDKGFKILKKINRPPVQIIAITEFYRLMEI